uniref:Uncharacterized protein n=1 Tax=Panagrolaimus superbus TaxID=310955 RepID=A0A914ZDE6_9BILA
MSNSNNSNNNTDGNSGNNNQPTKKSGWRRLIAKFRRKPKPSSETTSPTLQTTQSAFDLPQESDGPGGGCVKKKKKDSSDDEVTVEANTSWKPKPVRKTRSMEGALSGKSTKKVRTSKRQRRKKKRPSKETIDDTVVFDDVTQTQEQTQEEKTVDASAKGGPKRHQHIEDELDQSRKVSRKKSPSKEGDDLSISKSVQRGFRNFRDKRAKDLRSVKTFISRKYQERAMQKVVAQVEARKQKRTEPSQDSSSNTNVTKLHHGDDVFPQRRPHRKSNRQMKPDSNNNVTPVKIYTKPETSVDATGLVLVEQNNDNDGQLFLSNGRPFWQQHGKGKPGEPDDDDELTDDELPMNAEIILDVHRGKIKLTDMPRTTVTLEPYGPTETLEGRDNVFFTRDLIFSNTVRSMINLNDDLADHTNPKPPAERKCKFEYPHQLHRYSRAHQMNLNLSALLINMLKECNSQI